MKAFAYLVFPNAIVSVLPEGSLQVGDEPIANGVITSVTQGGMSGILPHLLFLVPSIGMLMSSEYVSVFPSISLGLKHMLL